MADLNKEQILPAENEFIKLSEAEGKLQELINSAPIGGTLFGITASHFAWSMLSREEERDQSWSICTSMKVPRYSTMLFGKLANWGIPGSTRRIEFVVKAKADCVTVTREGTPKRRDHRYIVLNGSYQKQHHGSIEMEHARPFRDREARRWYNTTMETGDFDQLLNVIKSEFTGEPAFPQKKIR